MGKPWTQEKECILQRKEIETATISTAPSTRGFLWNRAEVPEADQYNHSSHVLECVQ